MTAHTRLNEVRSIVYTHFRDTVATLQSGDDYDGVWVGFNTNLLSLGGQLVQGAEKGPQPNDKPWVRLVVRHNERIQETLGKPGTRRFRNEATIFCSIFVPLDNDGGPQFPVDKFAEALIDIWDSKRLTGSVQTYASFPRDLAPETAYLEIMVETDMSYDERA